MNYFYVIAVTMTLLLSNLSFTNAQRFDPDKRCTIDANGECVPNVLLTAVPFLRLIPDARSAAIGDAGLGLSPDPNSIHLNSSKLAFVDRDIGFAGTFTPWLKSLGLTDVFYAYLAGYYKINELQTIGTSLKYFSLGAIAYSDINGLPEGTGNPRELEFAVSYNRKLSDNLSAGLTSKLIHSNLASGRVLGGQVISSANVIAVDLSLTYRKEVGLSTHGGLLTIGTAITNLGSKATYTATPNKDFIPANFGIGTALKTNMTDRHSITVAVDINKLLVPTPINSTLDLDGTVNLEYDANVNGIPDHKEQSTIGAAVNSFGDAPGGFAEEMQEISYSLGMEYWYNKLIAVRAGYFYEHPLKGYRQFLTAGIGVKYKAFGLNLSYLKPTNNWRNPLDKTIRVGVLFDFAARKSGKENEVEPVRN